jgi:DNA transposition AAA+ family ATPase
MSDPKLKLSTSTPPAAADAAPADSEEWSGTNLAGDIVAAGIAKNAPEYHDDLRWWWGYAAAKDFSQADCARLLGVDGGTYSRVYRGEYKNAQQLVLPPPVKMLTRIRVTRQQERDNAAQLNKGRVMTPTVADIWSVCKKAWADRQIAMIWGESHIGKTEGLVWFRDENNHGATIYVDLQGIGGVQDLYRAFARALKLSPDTPIAKLMPRVFAAIDRTTLVLVDEFHHITYAYQKGASNKMVNALKSIKDRCGCAMVICATNVAREEFTEGMGKEAKLLKQLWRRGVIKLQLPDALRVGDVRAFAKTYGLAFPAEPERGDDTWKALRSAHATFAGLEVCENIAYNFGILHLVSVLRDGSKLAAKRDRELQWKDVIEAQGVYDRLAAKKTV